MEKETQTEKQARLEREQEMIQRDQDLLAEQAAGSKEDRLVPISSLIADEDDYEEHN